MENHGATITKNARMELEQKTGKKVVTSLNARDGIILSIDANASENNSDEN